MEELVKNEIEFYSRLAKPLVLNLPKPKDRILAAAWIRKFKDEGAGVEQLRANYLKLLLFSLQRRRLVGLFADDPENYNMLEEFPPGYDLNELAKNIIEQEQIDRKERIKRQLIGDMEVFPAYITDCSPDLTEYVAAQDIPNFGVHAYYAISKEPINRWQRSDRAIFPKGVKSAVDTSATGAPGVGGAQSEPSCVCSPTSKKTKPPLQTPPPEDQPPPEEGAPSPEGAPPPEAAEGPECLKKSKEKAKKSKKYGRHPPTAPLGTVLQEEERLTPTWGTNLLDVQEPILKIGEEEKEEGAEGEEPTASEIDISVKVEDMRKIVDEWKQEKILKKKPKLGQRKGKKPLLSSTAKSVQPQKRVPSPGSVPPEYADVDFDKLAEVGMTLDDLKLMDTNLDELMAQMEEPADEDHEPEVHVPEAETSFERMLREEEEAGMADLAQFEHQVSQYAHGVVEDQSVVDIYQDDLESSQGVHHTEEMSTSWRRASPALSGGIPLTCPKPSPSPRRSPSPERSFIEEGDDILTIKQPPLGSPPRISPKTRQRPPRAPSPKKTAIPPSAHTAKIAEVSHVFEETQEAIQEEEDSFLQFEREFEEEDEFERLERQFQQDDTLRSPIGRPQVAPTSPSTVAAAEAVRERARKQQELLFRPGSPEAREILQEAKMELSQASQPQAKSPLKTPPAQLPATRPKGYSSPPAAPQKNLFPDMDFDQFGGMQLDEELPSFPEDLDNIMEESWKQFDRHFTDMGDISGIDDVSAPCSPCSSADRSASGMSDASQRQVSPAPMSPYAATTPQYSPQAMPPTPPQDASQRSPCPCSAAASPRMTPPPQWPSPRPQGYTTPPSMPASPSSPVSPATPEWVGAGYQPPPRMAEDMLSESLPEDLLSTTPPHLMYYPPGGPFDSPPSPADVRGHYLPAKRDKWCPTSVAPGLGTVREQHWEDFDQHYGEIADVSGLDEMSLPCSPCSGAGGYESPEELSESAEFELLEQHLREGSPTYVPPGAAASPRSPQRPIGPTPVEVAAAALEQRLFASPEAAQRTPPRPLYFPPGAAYDSPPSPQTLRRDAPIMKKRKRRRTAGPPAMGTVGEVYDESYPPSPPCIPCTPPAQLPGTRPLGYQTPPTMLHEQEIPAFHDIDETLDLTPPPSPPASPFLQPQTPPYPEIPHFTAPQEKGFAQESMWSPEIGADYSPLADMLPDDLGVLPEYDDEMYFPPGYGRVATPEGLPTREELQQWQVSPSFKDPLRPCAAGRMPPRHSQHAVTEMPDVDERMEEYAIYQDVPFQYTSPVKITLPPMPERRRRDWPQQDQVAQRAYSPRVERAPKPRPVAPPQPEPEPCSPCQPTSPQAAPVSPAYQTSPRQKEVIQRVRKYQPTFERSPVTAERPCYVDPEMDTDFYRIASLDTSFEETPPDDFYDIEAEPDRPIYVKPPRPRYPGFSPPSTGTTPERRAPSPHTPPPKAAPCPCGAPPSVAPPRKVEKKPSKKRLRETKSSQLRKQQAKKEVTLSPVSRMMAAKKAKQEEARKKRQLQMPAQQQQKPKQKLAVPRPEHKVVMYPTRKPEYSKAGGTGAIVERSPILEAQHGPVDLCALPKTRLFSSRSLCTGAVRLEKKRKQRQEAPPCGPSSFYFPQEMLEDDDSPSLPYPIEEHEVPSWFTDSRRPKMRPIIIGQDKAKKWKLQRKSKGPRLGDVIEEDEPRTPQRPTSRIQPSSGLRPPSMRQIPVGLKTPKKTSQHPRIPSPSYEQGPCGPCGPDLGLDKETLAELGISEDEMKIFDTSSWLDEFDEGEMDYETGDVDDHVAKMESDLAEMDKQWQQYQATLQGFEEEHAEDIALYGDVVSPQRAESPVSSPHWTPEGVPGPSRRYSPMYTPPGEIGPTKAIYVDPELSPLPTPKRSPKFAPAKRICKRAKPVPTAAPEMSERRKQMLSQCEQISRQLDMLGQVSPPTQPKPLTDMDLIEQRVIQREQEEREEFERMMREEREVDREKQEQLEFEELERQAALADLGHPAAQSTTYGIPDAEMERRAQVARKRAMEQQMLLQGSPRKDVRYPAQGIITSPPRPKSAFGQPCWTRAKPSPRAPSPQPPSPDAGFPTVFDRPYMDDYLLSESPPHVEGFEDEGLPQFVPFMTPPLRPQDVRREIAERSQKEFDMRAQTDLYRDSRRVTQLPIWPYGIEEEPDETSPCGPCGADLGNESYMGAAVVPGERPPKKGKKPSKKKLKGTKLFAPTAEDSETMRYAKEVKRRYGLESSPEMSEEDEHLLDTSIPGGLPSPLQLKPQIPGWVSPDIQYPPEKKKPSPLQYSFKACRALSPAEPYELHPDLRQLQDYSPPLRVPEHVDHLEAEDLGGLHQDFMYSPEHDPEIDEYIADVKAAHEYQMPDVMKMWYLQSPEPIVPLTPPSCGKGPCGSYTPTRTPPLSPVLGSPDLDLDDSFLAPHVKVKDYQLAHFLERTPPDETDAAFEEMYTQVRKTKKGQARVKPMFFGGYGERPKKFLPRWYGAVPPMNVIAEDFHSERRERDEMEQMRLQRQMQAQEQTELSEFEMLERKMAEEAMREGLATTQAAYDLPQPSKRREQKAMLRALEQQAALAGSPGEGATPRRPPPLRSPSPEPYTPQLDDEMIDLSFESPEALSPCTPYMQEQPYDADFESLAEDFAGLDEFEMPEFDSPEPSDEQKEAEMRRRRLFETSMRQLQDEFGPAGYSPEPPDDDFKRSIQAHEIDEDFMDKRRPGMRSARVTVARGMKSVRIPRHAPAPGLTSITERTAASRPCSRRAQPPSPAPRQVSSAQRVAEARQAYKAASKVTGEARRPAPRSQPRPQTICSGRRPELPTTPQVSARDLAAQRRAAASRVAESARSAMIRRAPPPQAAPPPQRPAFAFMPPQVRRQMPQAQPAGQPCSQACSTSRLSGGRTSASSRVQSQSSLRSEDEPQRVVRRTTSKKKIVTRGKFM